jgi:hypothetical protein
MSVSNKSHPIASAGEVSSRRDLIARYIMIALSIATLGAFANAAYEFGAVPPDRVVSHTWEMLAYIVFAGLFGLLAIYPRRMLGLWELVIFHKLGVTLFSLISLGSAAGAVASDNPALRFAIDGVLVSLTIASYVLAKGWLAWKYAR